MPENSGSGYSPLPIENTYMLGQIERACVWGDRKEELLTEQAFG